LTSARLDTTDGAVLALDVLLFGFGSCVGELIVAVLRYGPDGCTVATMVSVAEAPLAKLPIDHRPAL